MAEKNFAEAIAESLIKNLFPDTTASIAINFAKNVESSDNGTSLYANIHAAHARRNPARFANQGIFKAVIDVGKKVAKAAGMALLQEAIKYLKDDARNAREITNIPASDIGKFSDQAIKALPMIRQLAARAIPITPTTSTNDYALYNATVQQAVTVTTDNFISQAQVIVNSYSNQLDRNNVAKIEEALNNLARTVIAGVGGALETIVPVINQKIQGSGGVARAAPPTDGQRGTIVPFISDSATNSTTRAALLRTYTTEASSVGLRGAQAIIDTAEELHKKFQTEIGTNLTKEAEDTWWENFVAAVNGIGPVIGFFSPSLLQNSNKSLQDLNAVQATSLSSGIVSGANTLNTLRTQFPDGATTAGFWDTLKGVASTVGNVVAAAAPIVAGLIPLL